MKFTSLSFRSGAAAFLATAFPATVFVAAAVAEAPRSFTVPPDRQQMIGVTYATVESRPLRRTIRAAGTVGTTTQNHWDYVSRVDGYVHDLHVSAPGDPVEKGQVLMDLYSPDLVATENEFVDLLRMRDQGLKNGNPSSAESAGRLIAGARARLRQWNVADADIDALEASRKPPEFLPLKSPFRGVVEAIPVHQGRHVSVGDHLVDIVDLSSVWIWAEVYQDELPLVKTGMPVSITSTSLPGASLSGKVALIDPFLDDRKRTGRVRIDVGNADGRLHPDAYVDVDLEVDGGTGLAVPVSAVLPTGERAIAFVDKGGGTLEPRFIQLGGKFGEYYRVTGGLAAGERVVASANFLIDAESKVQGALKSW